jgi:hypothetical protein
MPINNAQFARLVSKITRMTSQVQADLAQGMWNPDFCSSECSSLALSLCGDLRDKIGDIEKLTEQKPE